MNGRPTLLYMKILVRTPSELREAVFAEPAIHALREHYPEAEIWAAGPEWTADLFAGRDLFDGLIPIPVDENIKDMRDSIAQVRKGKFSAALVLNDGFGAVLLTYASGIPKRWGYRREGALLMLTKSVKPVERLRPRHRTEHYLDLVSGLGFECGRRVPLLEVTEEEKLQAARTLSSLKVRKDRPFIIMAPGSSRGQAGRWPLERFAEAAGRIEKETGAPIMLVGSDLDDRAAEEMSALLTFKALRPPANTDLRKIMALLAAGSLVIAADNNILHIASALGTPVVPIIGPSDPEAMGPLNEKHSIVCVETPCRPCLYNECPWDHRCMLNITPDMVVEAARKLL